MQGFLRAFRPGVAVCRALSVQLVRRVLNILSNIEGDGETVTIEKPLDANGRGWRVIVNAAAHFARLFKPRPNSLDAIQEGGAWRFANMPASVGVALGDRRAISGGSPGVGVTYLNLDKDGGSLSAAPGGVVALPVCRIITRGGGNDAKDEARQFFHGQNAEFRIREPDGLTVERPNPYFYTGNPFAFRLWVDGFHTVADKARLDTCHAPARFRMSQPGPGNPPAPNRLDWVSFQEIREHLETRTKEEITVRLLSPTPGTGDFNGILEPWLKYYIAEYQKKEAANGVYPQRLTWGMDTPLLGWTTRDPYGSWADATTGNFTAAGATLADDYPVDNDISALEAQVDRLDTAGMISAAGELRARAEALANAAGEASSDIAPTVDAAAAISQDANAAIDDTFGARLAIDNAAQAISALEGGG